MSGNRAESVHVEGVTRQGKAVSSTVATYFTHYFQQRLIPEMFLEELEWPRKRVLETHHDICTVYNQHQSTTRLAWR